jgi:hypothetical protein
MWNVFFSMKSVVVTSGVLVFWISVDEDCVEWRLDVCPVDRNGIGSDEIWSDDVKVAMKVEISTGGRGWLGAGGWVGNGGVSEGGG